MYSKVVLVFVGLVVVSQAKRPPWYKPCWIYLCGMDLTDPVCAWDPHHGARLFRNDCEMDRHNFCYNRNYDELPFQVDSKYTKTYCWGINVRNYGVVEADNNVEQDIKLCAKLKGMVERADKKPSVIQDGNVKVQFMLDNHQSEKQDRDHRKRERFDFQNRYHNRHGGSAPRVVDRSSDIFLEGESSYES